MGISLFKINYGYKLTTLLILIKKLIDLYKNFYKIVKLI